MSERFDRWLHRLSFEWLMIATAIETKGGATTAGFTTAVYSHAVKTHTVLYTLLLHAALLTDHSVHYAQWELEPIACLVALLLDKDQRGRTRGREGK